MPGRFGFDEALELCADEELEWGRFDKEFGLFIGNSGADDDGLVGQHLLPVFIGGLGVKQVNRGFFPAVGFKYEGAAFFDCANAEAQFRFMLVQSLDCERSLSLDLDQGLIELEGGDGVGPMERIVFAFPFVFFESPGFEAGEGHGGGEATSLSIANDGAAGSPVDEGDAVERGPAG